MIDRARGKGPLHISLCDQIFPQSRVAISLYPNLAVADRRCGIGIGIDFVIMGIKRAGIGL